MPLPTSADPYRDYFRQPVHTLAGHLKESLGIEEDTHTIFSRLSQKNIISALEKLTLFNETNREQHDVHGRFNERWAPADIHLPVVNKLLAECGLHVHRQQKFSVVFTHDIDWVTPFEPTSIAKSLYYKLRRIKQHWVSPGQSLNRNLFHATILRMLELEAQNGISATYFMMSGPHGYGRYDTRYDIANEAARKVIRSIENKNGRIGLHGSYAAREKESYKTEKANIEQVTGKGIRAHRNHYLRFHGMKLSSHMQQAGLHYDFSIGFTTKAGFRSGVCTPYRMIDVIRQKVSDVTEIPLLVMDRLDYLEEGDAFFDRYRQLLAEVKKYNGCISVLTHPENFPFVPRFWDFYKKLIGISVEMGADISGNYA